MLKFRFLQKFGGGGVLERWGVGAIAAFQLWQLSEHKDRDVVRLIRRVRRERKSLQSAFEAFLVFSIARTQSRLPGDMAEVGVFEGATARLICEAKGERSLHLFDTFSGLPPDSPRDAGVHRLHQYACSRHSVEHYLAAFDNVFIHEGRFPDSAQGLPERKYSFVHLDVDLYESTRDCLEYFYGRLLPGGAIISHDYSMLEGVKNAVDEFLADKPERLIEQPTTQCVIFKQ
jgi:O-methyltransferase